MTAKVTKESQQINVKTVRAEQKFEIMEQIELSNIVIDGLKCLNTSINGELTKKLISNAVKMALYSDASE